MFFSAGAGLAKSTPSRGRRQRGPDVTAGVWEVSGGFTWVESQAWRMQLLPHSQVSARLFRQASHTSPPIPINALVCEKQYRAARAAHYCSAHSFKLLNPRLHRHERGADQAGHRSLIIDEPDNVSSLKVQDRDA